MSYLIGKPIVAVLDASGFNGVTTAFAALLPSEPDLTGEDVVLIHSGVGALKRVASAPTAGQFALSGAGNRTVTFGYAPISGDFVHAIFVDA
jgi:hypothetical protein